MYVVKKHKSSYTLYSNRPTFLYQGYMGLIWVYIRLLWVLKVFFSCSFSRKNTIFKYLLEKLLGFEYYKNLLWYKKQFCTVDLGQ